MSAEAALNHPYFQSLGERVHQLDDSKCLRDQGQPESGKEAASMGVTYSRVWSLGSAGCLGHMAPLHCSHLELRGWIPPEMEDLPGRVLTGGCLGSVGFVGMGVWFHPGLPILFSCLAASIFSLKEIQLQKDPGYRGLAFQHPGRDTCSSPLPHTVC